MPGIKCIYSTGVPLAYHGIGTIAYYAARGLYRAGMLKKILCLSHKRKTEIPETLIKDVVPGGRITSGLFRKMAIIFGSANGYGMQGIIYDNCASRFIDTCDIFHCWALESVKSLRIAKDRGAKSTILERPSSHIVKQRSIFKEEFGKRGLKKYMDNIEVERNITAYEEADYIVVPSDFAYKSFLDSGFDINKVVKIPYGYDPQIFKPAPRKDNIFRVLFCGNIILRKGIVYLLEAWDKLNFKDAELVLVGRIFNETKAILKKYISKNRSIKIKGFMPYSEIVNQYQQADVFILPSLEEGSALVNYEAMACGLPVITTFNSGSVTRNGMDGFIIQPQNTAQICEKLLYFYDNRQKAKQMGLSASEYVKNYTWEKYSEKLRAFYEGLL